MEGRASGSAGFVPSRSSDSVSFHQIAIYILGFLGFVAISTMAGFYSFYTFLFSKYFIKKRIARLCAYGLSISLLCGLIAEMYLSVTIGGLGDNKGENIFPNHSISEIILVIALISINSLANGIIGLVMRGFITSYTDIKLKEDLNKKNYEMELALVKSQINPHFLFNTINNIDVLIQKDSAKASAYLNKLSDIMRFMLYETKTEKILLKQELEYVEKYIDLQKIRTSNLQYVNYNEKGDTGGLMIAPMLFIPLIENAFKHAENKKINNAINISVVIENGKIIFDCENSYSSDTQTKLGHSGLGNELIRKRLNLLYPGKHTLVATDENKIYKVKMTIRGN